MKWHDGKPFTSADVKVYLGRAEGRATKLDIVRNPADLVHQPRGDDQRRPRRHLQARPAAAVVLSMLASGYSPVYACHVPGRDMRSKPIGTGPFKMVEFKRNRSIKLVRNPDYWKKGRPYLDAIDWKIVPNRSTRMLGFTAGEFDMTFRFRRHLPMLQRTSRRRSRTRCARHGRPASTATSWSIATNRRSITLRSRRAMVLAIDIRRFPTS